MLPDINDSHLRLHCKSNISENFIYLFQFKLFKYFYDRKVKSFNSISFSLKTTQEILIKEFLKGLDKSEVAYNKIIFGDCDLNIKVDGVMKLILKEVTDPFYIFQLFSITLWYVNAYMNYATIIVVTTLISLAVSVWETRSNLVSIQQMAKYSCPVDIYRRSTEDKSKKHFSTSSVELVPGDLFELPEDGLALPCDCILVSGTVIVNESMLTGESTPIIKTHIPNTNASFDPQVDKKYILFAGTKIIQKRAHGNSKVMGLVCSIGFNTEKGNLIRSILFPKEVEFKFQKDSIRYILFMGFLSIIGFLISLPFMIENNIEFIDIIFRALDLVTTTVPPSLPACLGIGISYALSRLKKWGIICINRERVNVSGKVNMICFDKTGTLTEDHLDVHGFRPVKLVKGAATFDGYLQDCGNLSETSFNYYKDKMNGGNIEKSKDLKMLFMESISSCHSITKVNGKLVGDPIDIKMFEATGWTLNENLENQENYDSLISTYIRPPQEKDLKDKLTSSDSDEDVIFKTHYELGIVRRFDFSSKLQRMSVLVKNVNEPYFKVFCKGSPEKIKELCKQDTIPGNFNEILSKYTTKGFRVLAISMKLLKMDYMQSQKIERETAESNMVFLGLLVVQNKLKSKTTSSIETLQEANLKMVMATGDNILTAISVAKECMLIRPDSVIYTCEINKENNENILKWNVAENFLKDDDKSVIDEQVFGTRMSLMINEEMDSRGYTMHLSPESFEEEYLKGGDVKLYLPEIKEEKAEIEDSEDDVINIDLENHPIQAGSDTDYVIGITGTTFETLWKLRNKYVTSNQEKYKVYYDTFRFILQNCYIFARMSPEHKTILVDCLREEKFTVCMCGDGANDCGALRAADVGVSLSREEASIAAHFTSNIPDISCLIKLFREGKASLVTSIQTFKYMMIYSLIQFTSVTLLMIFRSYLTDNQFLASDLFIIFPMAILIARTGAYSKLTHHQPTGALISLPIVSSILIQTIIQFSAQFGGWLLLSYQEWYVNKCDTKGDFVQPCMDNTVRLSYLINK
jgi:cation-transporting P-type ATPase 13A2